MRFQRLVVVLVTILAGPGAALAREAVKSFPSYQCRYTLPGKDWNWDDLAKIPKTICVAHSEDGLVFLVGVTPVSPGTVIDAKFASEFDPSKFRGGSIAKRASRLTTFKGLPCCQAEMLVNGTRSAAIRMVIANGFAYQIQLIGDADPVEKRADFEAIMNGFEFTSPPAPPAAKAATDSADDEKNPAYVAGQVLGYCVIGVVLVGLATWGRRRK
jgi:hypothetical protein